MENPFLYALVGWFASFLGTLPFGPINLAVVKTTVDHNQLRGLEIALAAALIEILQALVAILFGMAIGDYLDASRWLKVIIGGSFVLLAIVVWLRQSESGLRAARDPSQSFFPRGLMLAAVNPQAIPFWIFALATINQYAAFHFAGPYLLGFLTGVFLGKLGALIGFVVAANYLKRHLRQSSIWVNRTLASILLLIGLNQLWQAVFT